MHVFFVEIRIQYKYPLGNYKISNPKTLVSRLFSFSRLVGMLVPLRVLLHQLNSGSIKVIYFRSQLGFVSTAQDLQFSSQLEMQGGIDWGSCILQNEILKDMAL